MIVSLRDDFEMISIDFSLFLFYFIPKGFLNCQFSIFNCQLFIPEGDTITPHFFMDL